MIKLSASAARGYTLVETVVASALLSAIILLALSATTNISNIIAAQERSMRTDQQAQRALAAISRELSSGLLPVNVARADVSREIFEDIDNPDYGFAGDTGTRWRQALVKGVDNIAFVNLIDARGVGDYNDGNNHLQLGQTRDGVGYLGASASFRDITEENGDVVTKLFIRDPGENVNVLAILEPGEADGTSGLNSLAFEIKEIPSENDWKDMNNGVWQNITAFMAIRFVPLTDDSLNPVILREADAANWPQFKGKVDAIDLDNNGSFDDEFQIGKLQLLYSGGKLPYVSGTNVLYKDIDQFTMNLTSYCVLRHKDADKRTPIFQFASTTYPGDDEAASDTSLMRVRLLLLDRTEVDVDGANVTIRAQQFTQALDLQARWYETFIALSNMTR